VSASLVVFSFVLLACGEDEVDPPIVAAGGAGGSASAGASAGGKAATGSDQGTPTPFLGACASADECEGEGAVCHLFPSKGQLCTVRCDADAACPAPSPGCNPQGVCRAP
jgi:hypothetical protein